MRSAAWADGLQRRRGCRSSRASIDFCRARSAPCTRGVSTPHVALLVQAVISAVFVMLGQAGTSVRGAYDVLVSMSIITYFVPFLFMFAALIKVQGEPAGAGRHARAGRIAGAVILGALGFVTTSIAIVLACVPAADEPNKPLAVVKIVGLSVVLLAIGAGVYAAGRSRD